MISNKLYATLREEFVLKEPSAPQGTIALMLLFILLTAGLWFNAFSIIMSRGVTQ